MRILLTCLVLLSVGNAARAAEARGVVAVLPFDFRDARLDDGEKTALLESIRTDAADAFSPSGYTVLTGENTLAILQDNGVDAAKACDSTCALDAARELKASLFLSATVATADGTHLAFVRLFESARGTMLASAQIEGKNVLELRSAFQKQAPQFFQKALAAIGAAPPATASPIPAPASAPSAMATPVPPPAPASVKTPGAIVVPTPVPAAPSGDWVNGWAQRHGEAWNGIQTWVRRHPDASIQFVAWERRDPAGFQQVVDWVLSNPKGTPLLFAREHPRWEQIDVTMRVHAIGFGFLFDWIRKHSKAALAVAEHPRGFQSLTEQARR